MTEEGGTQFLSFSIGVATPGAATPYRFFVPGVEGQAIAVVVP